MYPSYRRVNCLSSVTSVPCRDLFSLPSNRESCVQQGLVFGFVFNTHAIHNNIGVRGSDIKVEENGTWWELWGLLVPGEFFPQPWTGPQNPALQGLSSPLVPLQIQGLEGARGTVQGEKHGILLAAEQCLRPVPVTQHNAKLAPIILWCGDRAQPIPLRPGMPPPLAEFFSFKPRAALCMPDLGSRAHRRGSRAGIPLNSIADKGGQVRLVQANA